MEHSHTYSFTYVNGCLYAAVTVLSSCDRDCKIFMLCFFKEKACSDPEIFIRFSFFQLVFWSNFSPCIPHPHSYSLDAFEIFWFWFSSDIIYWFSLFLSCLGFTVLLESVAWGPLLVLDNSQPYTIFSSAIFSFSVLLRFLLYVY